MWLCSCELPQGHRGGTLLGETSGSTASMAIPDPPGGPRAGSSRWGCTDLHENGFSVVLPKKLLDSTLCRCVRVCDTASVPSNHGCKVSLRYNPDSQATLPPSPRYPRCPSHLSTASILDVSILLATETSMVTANIHESEMQTP